MSDDDEDDEYYDDDDNWEDEVDVEEAEEEEEYFNILCSMLKSNDRTVLQIGWGQPNLRDKFFTDVPFDDSHCILFAQALENNTHLQDMRVIFHPSDAIRITPQGSASLVNGLLEKSKVKRVTVYGGPASFHRRLSDAIRKSQNIQDLAIGYARVDFTALSAVIAFRNDAMTVNFPNLVKFKLTHCTLNEDNLKLLALALNNNKSVQILSLDTNRIDDQRLSAFINFWSPDSVLVELNLSQNCLRADGAKMLMRAVAMHPSLVKLDISGNSSIGFDGIRMLGEELGNAHLKEFYIERCVDRNDIVNDNDSKMLACDALAEGLQVNTTMERLSSDIRIGIGPERLQRLLRATSTRPTLLQLDLLECTPIELLTIGQELSNARLKELFLSRVLENDIEEKGLWNPPFQALAQGLRNNMSLQTLSLDSFCLDAFEVHILMVALRSHPSMEKLMLSGIHPDIGYLGIQRIGEHLPFTNLKSVVLRTHNDSFTDVLIAGDAANEACRALAGGLRNSTAIQELRCSYNCFNSSHVLLLVRAVTNHPSMTSLGLCMDVSSIDLGFLKLIADEIPLLRLTAFDVYNISETTPPNPESKAFFLVRRAFQDGVMNNLHLCQLTLSFLGDDEEIEFYMELNRLGRLRVLEGQGLAPVLWCYLLDKLKEEPSQMYYFLRERPWLIS